MNTIVAKLAKNDCTAHARTTSVLLSNPLVQLCKELFDRLFGLAVLILVSPLLLLVAIAIKIDSRGPILFLQERGGKDGKIFTIYKFRTMTDTHNTPDTAPQKTRIGTFLRSSSIDELPQFLNVLLGDMSVIGPRPHATYHDEYYAPRVNNYSMRYRVKPGLTGLAQVHGRRGMINEDREMAERVAYDNQYIDNWSPLMELKILLSTLPVVIRSTNAH